MYRGHSIFLLSFAHRHGAFFSFHIFHNRLSTSTFFLFLFIFSFYGLLYYFLHLRTLKIKKSRLSVLVQERFIFFRLGQNWHFWVFRKFKFDIRFYAFLSVLICFISSVYVSDLILNYR